MARLALFGLFSFSSLPIALVGLAGGLVCAAALVALVAGANAGHAALFFLGGAQLLAVWVLGQYVSTMSDEARGRPLYLVRDAVNVDVRPNA
jgi:dolichol-phosphate mannosyltransferase